MTVRTSTSSPSRSGFIVPLAAAFFATLLGLPVNAGVSIPKVPLQSGNAVPPNIMFVLDDSGSMQSEIMPDELTWRVTRYRNDGSTYEINPVLSIGYVYPRVNYPYGDTGGGQYANLVADPNDEYSRIVRSSYFNKLYYNPAVTYTPWSRANGLLYPNAPANCAPHNPQNTGVDCRDLTITGTNENGNFWQRNSSDATCRTSACFAENVTREYWPATYYTYKGSNGASAPDWNSANYTERRIEPATASYTGEGRIARTDCIGGVCTYAQEVQNFANWYTYYRSRILAARAGIGRAFSQIPEATEASPAPRVGFAAINKESGSIDGVSTPTVVRGVREFTGANRENFFSDLYGHTIPARGTPLRRALDDVGKYFKRTDNSGPWSKTPGTANTAEHLSCRANYSILMTDGYWNGDPASSPASEDNDSTAGDAIARPNGTTYQFQSGTEPFADGVSNTLADVAMYYWKTDLRGSLKNNVPAKSPNVAFWQHMVTYGVGLGVTGNVMADVAFKAIETATDIAWAAPNTNPGKIDDLLHAAVNSRGGFFNASNPTAFAEGLRGVLTSISERQASGSNVAANSTATKDTNRVFQASYMGGQWSGELVALPVNKGVIGSTPNWKASEGIPVWPATRKVFTWSGLAGASFPTATQTTALTAPVADYLRGDRSNELQNDGTLRNRSHLLGDIVNSNPVYVQDGDTVFVGANDGMLHAINATTGAERFAYVPGGISLSALKSYSASSYSHEYFVDGPIVVSTKVQTPGKRILVGTLGRGGRGLFALDVTSPGTFAAGDVKWDVSGLAGLGNVLGRPVIAKLNNGKTGVIVGNGLNSNNDRAVLFVLDIETGAVLAELDTKNGSSATANGLSAPTGWDTNGDGTVDYIYAGDHRGNVWKFDLSASNANSWGSAYGNNASPSPMFTAKGPGNSVQPISGSLTLALDPSTYKLWVFFGTGRYLTLTDPGNKDVQSWYGLIDEGAAIGDHRSGSASLTQRFINVANADGSQRAFEPVSNLPVASKGWFIDLLAPPKPGTAQGERMVGSQFVDGTVLVASSIIPSADECSGGGTGFINALNAFTGTATDNPYFDVDGDGKYEMLTSDGKSVGIGSVATPGMPGDGFMQDDTIVVGDHTTKITSPKKPTSMSLGRISWREILTD